MPYDESNAYLRSFGVEPVESTAVNTAQAEELEAKGWRTWLMTLCPFAFEEDFSADHITYWGLQWSVLMRIRKQKEYILVGLPIPPQFLIEDREYVILLILGRGLAKSSTIEAMAMMKGCLIGAGYALTISEGQDQAEEHISNIKWLIDADESRVVEFYPHMAVNANVVFDGKKTKNRTDLFITVGGWICRAKGLDANLRGIRRGKWRPDLINIDDLDGINDSIAVSVKKLKQLLGSVFPTLARIHGQINVGQNIILETGVVNTIYTGQSDALADRVTIGVTNTFERFRLNLEYITYLDDADGRVHHKILPSAKATWKGVDIAAAQRFLSISGMDTFLAEYMNSFAHQKTGKVFEFDEARHLITWDMFQEKFGVRHIPGNWRAKAAGDIGYSKDSLSAWLFVARSAQNSKLPGRYFGYRSKTFMFDSIDDQAINMWEDFFPDPETGKKHFEATQEFADYPELFRVLNTRPRCQPYMNRFQYNPVKDKYELEKFDPFTWKTESGEAISDEEKTLFYVKQANRNFRSQIQSWVISHEKTGEQKTLAQKYGLPVSKVQRFEADAGVTEANHLLRGDYTQPHPFYPDEIVEETGLYRLGSPFIFFICRRIKAPEDDRDFKTFREQVGAQPWTQEKLGDLGLTKTIPFKYRSDHPDCWRMFCQSYELPDSTPKTIHEEVDARIDEKYKPKEGEVVTPEMQMSLEAATHAAKKKTIEELEIDSIEDFEDEFYDEDEE